MSGSEPSASPRSCSPRPASSGAAAADADVIVAEAESVAEQLLTEAREAADKLTTEAQERADGILARAYFEAEDLQRHTEEERARIREEVQSAGRAEIEDFRTRSAGLLDNAEDGLRDVPRGAVARRAAQRTVRGDAGDRPSEPERPRADRRRGAEPEPDEMVAADAPAAGRTTPRHVRSGGSSAPRRPDPVRTMRAGAIGVALIVVGLLGSGCDQASTKLDGGAAAEPVADAAPARPILVTQEWGVVDGLLSVVVRNTTDRTLRTRRGRDHGA